MLRRALILVFFLFLAVFIANERIYARVDRAKYNASSSFQDAYLSLLKSEGASIIKVVENDKRTGDRSVVFREKSCPEPYEIFEHRVVLSLPHHAQVPPLSEMDLKVIYYDKVWGDWSRLRNTVETIMVSFASVFGHSDLHDNMKALLLFIPKGCDNYLRLDWSQAWMRR